MWKLARRRMNPDKIAKRQRDDEKDLARYDTQAEEVFPEKVQKQLL